MSVATPAPRLAAGAAILLVVVLLSAASPVAHAACTAGNSVLTLTRVSQPSCLGTEIGVQWSKLVVSLLSDCTYTITGSWKDTNNNMGNSRSPYMFNTSSAAISYTTASGAQRSWTSTAYAVPFPMSSSSETFTATGQSVTTSNGVDFSGFTKTLQAGLPPYVQGPFGIATNAPANYTTKQLGSNAFQVFQPPTGCTFTYTITSGAFAGMQPAPCKAASSPACPAACGAGMYRQAQTGPGAGTSVCAYCPAGTALNSNGGCEPCPSGTVSTRAGAVSCTKCPEFLVPGIGAASCVPCTSPGIYGYASGAFTPYQAPTNNTIYLDGLACKPRQCPTNTLAAPAAQACYGVSSGDLCRAAPGNACKQAAPGDMPKGGAALVLQSADVSAKACAAGPAKLAEWLKGRVTWMGYDMTVRPGVSPYGGNTYPPYANWGLNWGVQGAAKSGPMLGYPICGNAHGGPGSQPALTQTAAILDSRAFLFATILNANHTAAGSVSQWEQGYKPVGWSVVATPGREPGTVTTRWFQDKGFGSCGITSLSATTPPGVCTLTFKVTAGAVLGVSGGAACPAGTYAVKAAKGRSETSCVMCGPGSFLSGGACRPCQGKSYGDEWGATKCKACTTPAPGSFSYEGAPPESNYFCYSSP